MSEFTNTLISVGVGFGLSFIFNILWLWYTNHKSEKKKEIDLANAIYFEIDLNIDIQVSSKKVKFVMQTDVLRNAMIPENISLFPQVIREALQAYYREALIYANTVNELSGPMVKSVYPLLDVSWRAVQTELINHYENKLLKSEDD